MNVAAFNGVGFGGKLQAPMTKKIVNRSLLKVPKSNLKLLCGSEEVSKAKAIVASATKSNALTYVATAQFPEVELPFLKVVDTTIVAPILNGVYGYKLSGDVLKDIDCSLLKASADKKLFRIVSKIVNWIPILNAIILDSVTAASMGMLTIEAAEAADMARKAGKSQEEVIKELKSFIEKMKQ